MGKTMVTNIKKSDVSNIQLLFPGEQPSRVVVREPHSGRKQHDHNTLYIGKPFEVVFPQVLMWCKLSAY
ncbi:hypothetical protein LJ754_16230, partial [Arthrobacter sp. zg-Y40]|uniref:hypothetical protein n=1 Tax=Arthrobacter sp. zg-Y40 TaxID=2886939 RepID=UPI001D148AF5